MRQLTTKMDRIVFRKVGSAAIENAVYGSLPLGVMHLTTVGR